MGLVLATTCVWFGLLLVRNVSKLPYVSLGVVLLFMSGVTSVYFYGSMRGVIVLVTLFFAIGFVQAMFCPNRQNTKE